MPPTIADLRKALKEAMQVELGTIPLYLSAFYSIDASPEVDATAQVEGARARVAILSIAIQEMLHLALAGNILLSTKEQPQLYDKNFIPTYPSVILKTKIEMALRKADKQNLQAFLLIEAPYFPPEEKRKMPEILPDSDSIGIHYTKIRYIIDYLEDPIHGATAEYQFDKSEFFGSSMHTIYSKSDAYEAIDLITEQGEGGISVPDSHYSVFVDFYQRKLAWKLLPIKENAKPSDYNNDAFLKQLSDAFDATYCYILLTLDVIWKTSRDTESANRQILTQNIHPIMSDIMTPIAELIVRRPFESGTASPCFAYYSSKSDGNPNTLSELHENIDSHLKSAIEETSDNKLKAVIGRIVRSLTNIQEPKA